MSDFTEISNIDFKDKIYPKKLNVNIDNMKNFTKETAQNLGQYMKDRAAEMNQNNKYIEDNKNYGENKSDLVETLKEKAINVKEYILPSNNTKLSNEAKEAEKYIDEKIHDNTNITS